MKKKKLDNKISEFVAEKFYPKDTSVKTIIKNSKDKKALDGLIKFEKELKAQIMWTHIKNNRREFSAKLGKKFDTWYEKFSKEPVIEKHKKEYLTYLKRLKNAKNSLRNKPKQLVASVKTKKPTNKDDASLVDKLVYDLHKISADSMGMSVDEYLEWRKKSLKAQKKYNEEHWVSPLTDGQVFTILYQKETKPYVYMGKPVSRENEFKIDRYKEFNKGWKEYKAKQAKAKDALEAIHLPKEVQKAGEQYRKMMESLNKTLEPLKKTTDVIKSWGNPFDLTTVQRGFGGYVNPPELIKGGLLDLDNRIVEKKDTGLDSYAKRHNLKNGVEIAEHWLANNTPEKLDYAVVDFNSIEALSDTIGITPAEAFEILCLYIKRSKKKYLQRIYERQQQILIEQLVNNYISEKEKRQAANKPTLTVGIFYKTKYVQEFLTKYPAKLDERRFGEKLKSWVKIFTSKAYKVN